MRNVSVAVREHKGEIVFLRRVVAGGANRSYGIDVARLAGLPKGVIARARQIMAQLERGRRDRGRRSGRGVLGTADSDKLRAELPSAPPPSSCAMICRAARGLAEGVIARARQIMAQLEGGGALGSSAQLSLLSAVPGTPPAAAPPTITPAARVLVDELAALDPDRMTPIAALAMLADLAARARNA